MTHLDRVAGGTRVVHRAEQGLPVRPWNLAVLRVARELHTPSPMQLHTISDHDLVGVIGGRGLSPEGAEQVRQGGNLAADFFAPSTAAPISQPAPAGGSSGGGKISPMRTRELEQQMLAY